MTRNRIYLLIASIAVVLTILVVALLAHPHDDVAAVTDPCGVARAQVNQASALSNAYKYREAYHAALAGLRADEKCRDEQTRLVNQGFLLSTKAMAEEAFSKRGDSSADFDRAIKLLQRCRDMTPKLDNNVSDLCGKQEQSDIQTRHQLSVRGIIVR